MEQGKYRFVSPITTLRIRGRRRVVNKLRYERLTNKWEAGKNRGGLSP